MGGTCSRQEKFKVLIQGLDAAGKTSVLYKLKLGEVVTTIPTIGFNVETVTQGGLDILCWDLGGRDKIRPLYRHYYPGTHGLIYVIDSTDVERLDEALDELNTYILQTDELKDAVVMVAANKQDLETAMSPADIEARLKEKHSIGIGMSVFVMPCSVMTEGSLEFMFNYFAKQMKRKKAKELGCGLIPKAWETAQEELETEKSKEGDAASGMFHTTKLFLLQGPFHYMKSVLFY